ncbi:hypothetical protein [Escherichia coli]|uniref:hypothetical protein n=1 Tax=Escherichia coli TaxID=562 RepID=UPI0025A59428|nr:hypothetical protein [Escherichia coli]
MNNESRYGAPNQDGPPGRTGENGQLQWIMKSVDALHAGQQDLLRKLEKLDIKVEMKQKGCAASADKERELMLEKHTRLEERISSNHALLEAKIENAFERAATKISDLKSEIIKWIVRVGLLFLVSIVGVAIKYIISAHQ